MGQPIDEFDLAEVKLLSADVSAYIEDGCLVDALMKSVKLSAALAIIVKPKHIGGDKL